MHMHSRYAVIIMTAQRGPQIGLGLSYTVLGNNNKSFWNVKPRLVKSDARNGKIIVENQERVVLWRNGVARLCNDRGCSTTDIGQEEIEKNQWLQRLTRTMSSNDNNDDEPASSIANVAIALWRCFYGSSKSSCSCLSVLPTCIAFVLLSLCFMSK